MSSELRHVSFSMLVWDADRRRANGAPERPEVGSDDVVAALADYLSDCVANWMADSEACTLPGVGADYTAYPEAL